MSFVKSIGEKKINFDFNKDFISIFSDKIKSNDTNFVNQTLKDLHPSDIANLIENLSDDIRAKLIEIEEYDIDPDIFIELNESIQTEVFQLLTADSIAKLLRRSQKPIFLVVNKVDNISKNALEFYELGFSEIFSISSVSGSGTGELLDSLINKLPKDEELLEDTLPRFAVVGRPNAGKSSFINALIGEERYIVTDVAGTTRDSIDTHYNRFGFDFKLVDTAGIRRKSKVKEDIEFYSVMRSIRAIEYSDVCILIVDGTRGFDGQVQNIFWLAHRNNKGVIILVNKWDLIEKNTSSAKKFEALIREAISPFKDVPILFISTKTKQRIFKAIEKSVEVYNSRSKKIATKAFNNVMLPIIEKTPPPSFKGKFVKIKFCAQLPTPYPQFVFFCNLPQYVKEPYKRFLENKIREEYNFEGVPIQIFFRKK